MVITPLPIYCIDKTIMYILDLDVHENISHTNIKTSII